MSRAPTRFVALLGLPLALGCASPADGHSASGVSSRKAALGEPTDGFPSWSERVLHVWVNRARAEPSEDLAICTECAEASCYAPSPPLAWDHGLARVARLHAATLASAGRAPSHDSPCTLVPDIATRYAPGPCGGDVACACVGGAASCTGACTTFAARMALFGASAVAENAASGSDPLAVFYAWLHEPEASSACGYRSTNGHRFNILGGSGALGVGHEGDLWVQDFAAGAAPDGIASGVHTPRSGASVEARASWYAATAPLSAQVNVGGSCTAMTLERGSSTNGTYLASLSVGSACARYYFAFETAGGARTYPTTGSFGVNCPEDWSAARPPRCGCVPTCGAALCGDDGCGGTCGLCADTEACIRGACECAVGATACGSACVRTDRDPAHCGACDAACAAGEACVRGACIPPGVDAGPPPEDDAGRPDAGPTRDAAVDASVVADGGAAPVEGGCGCVVPGSRGGRDRAPRLPAAVAAAAAWILGRRSRRAR